MDALDAAGFKVGTVFHSVPHLAYPYGSDAKPVVMTLRVKFNCVTLDTTCGPLMLRGLKAWVDDASTATELIVSRPVMELLGFSVEDLLVGARKKKEEWDVSSVPTNELSGMANVKRLMAEKLNPPELDPDDGMPHQIEAIVRCDFPGIVEGLHSDMEDRMLPLTKADVADQVRKIRDRRKSPTHRDIAEVIMQAIQRKLTDEDMRLLETPADVDDPARWLRWFASALETCEEARRADRNFNDNRSALVVTTRWARFTANTSVPPKFTGTGNFTDPTSPTGSDILVEPSLRPDITSCSCVSRASSLELLVARPALTLSSTSDRLTGFTLVTCRSTDSTPKFRIDVATRCP
ncbi:hypothetical protein DYB28_009907 [Aphanomyces astaci]|uniref:Uncharacterized protein n=1 Tax=Aphanomyces astaci TaxID=112090 RepID=A0A9X8HEI3_APHAT|nr:hypothetical protein DYB28_009907 [Aphanomyces astaci]